MEFYYEYYKAGMIKEAWIILGKDAHESKGLFFEDSSVKTGAISGGERRNKSSLLIKIGNLIISEWSHEGAMRFWSDDEEHPVLYKDQYSAKELRMKSKKNISHFGPDRYYWQSKAAEYIRRKTGIKSPSRKF